VLDRFTKLALVGLLVVIGIVAAQPYIDRYLLSGEPRQVMARADLSEAETTTIEIFEQVAPSVVQVVARGPGAAAPIPRQNGATCRPAPASYGTRPGHVVTNNHVVEGASEVFIRLASGEMARARRSARRPATTWPCCTWPTAAACRLRCRSGTSSDLRVGQFAFAIGNPFGLDQTLTTGVISALTRRLPTSTGREIPT
jgi:2-alkenal reductase